MRTGLVALFAAAGLTLTACTGVPGSSAPSIVQHLGAGQTVSAPPPPPAGADPRSLVQSFLANNAADAANPGSVRAYLTPKANWNDFEPTVTILDSVQVGPYDKASGTVTATGRKVANLDPNGNYSPDLNGTGQGGEFVPFVFSIARVGGQNRIDRVFPQGLVLSLDEFERTYQQRVVYFYDAEGHYLVPDVRYSALTDPQALANWLMLQLAAGPRTALQNAETNGEFPAQVDARHVPQVKVGNITTIEIPGAGGLSSAHISSLAAQLASTLDQAVPLGLFTITDGGRPVTIPAVDSTQFSASEFDSYLGPQNGLPTPAVYYLRDGGVVDGRGVALAGRVGSGYYNLASVGVARLPASSDLYIAGVSNEGRTQRLLIGTESGGLHRTSVTGQLSRPTWSAGSDEVWVASPTRVFKVTGSGQIGVVQLPTLPAHSKILAVRLSPDASRLAMVISVEGSSQAYIGTVARTDNQARVDDLTAISPGGVSIADVAWNDPLKLFLAGTLNDTRESRIIEVQVDGSLWTAQAAPELPGSPASITVAPSLPAWVSVGPAPEGTVWLQGAGSWTSPTGVGQTTGTNPIYTE